jgi:hypothetical protein
MNPEPTNPEPRNLDDLYVDHGGLAYRTTERIFRSCRLSHTVGHRVIGFIAITWVPLFCLALLEGRAIASTPEESFLLDFATYARFFLGVPLLIVAEVVVGPRLTSAGRQFINGGFVRAEDYPAFERAIARLARSRDSIWPESILLAIAMVTAWNISRETVYQANITTWRTPIRAEGEVRQISYTGLWLHLVAMPIIQFILYRWFWRLFLWGRFLFTVSRMQLNLVPTHADQAGGLGFLGTSHLSLGIFAFGAGAVMSAEAAFLIVFRNVDIQTFRVPYISYLVLIELIILGPLLLFLPSLTRARLEALREYSLLVCRYNRDFHDKWINGNARAEEQLLGSADIQSLADLGNSFEYVRSMKVVPFGVRVIVQLAVVASLPCIPLLLLVIPVDKILGLLAGAIF